MMTLVYYVGIILMIVGVLGYFMGKKGAAGLNEDSGQKLLAIGVILGLILVVASYLF